MDCQELGGTKVRDFWIEVIVKEDVGRLDVSMDTLLIVKGVHVGDSFRGANGAKGTISGFARIGRKMSIGDKHSPEIMDGVYCAGAMNLRHGYNKGPSSWTVSHIVQYPNGKRTLITLQNGKWRAVKPTVRVRVAANDNEPKEMAYGAA